MIQYYYPFKNSIEHFDNYNLYKFSSDIATMTTGGLLGILIAGPTGLSYGLWSGTLIALESDKGSIATLMTITMYSTPNELACSIGYISGFFAGPVLGPTLAACVISSPKTSNIEVAGNAIAGFMISTVPALTKELGEKWLTQNEEIYDDLYNKNHDTELTGQHKTI